MNEQSAIQLCLKHRDPAGFQFLVNQYRREAYLHAYGILRNEEDALDACQDAFARAFAAITQLPSLPQFYPWFYQILRNRCLNLLARRETAQRYQELAGGEPVDGRSRAGEPVTALEAQEERQLVREALERLRPDQREILTLKYVQEHSYEEIAGLLGIPRGTVMSRLYHARLALREACLQVEGAAGSNP